MTNPRLLLQCSRLAHSLGALCLLAFSFSAHAQSALETDRNAGKCAFYAIMSGKQPAAYAAFKMADKPKRAEQFLTAALDRAKRIRQNGNWKGLQKTDFLANMHVVLGP